MPLPVRGSLERATGGYRLADDRGRGHTTGSTFDEAMYVPSGGLAISRGARRATSSGVAVTGPTAAAKRAQAVIHQER